MKSIYNKVIVTILTFAFCFIVLTIQANKITTFLSVGSKGVGVGLNYKYFNLYTRYYYEYQDDYNYYVYYHYPSVLITKTIYSEDYANFYLGFGWSDKFFRQKYFFPGTFNTRNYFLSIPLGFEIIPFKKRTNFSFIIESGIQFEHANSWKLSRDWQLNLNRAVIDIRYKFGRKRG